MAKSPTKANPQKGPKRDQARLAEALRANLRRRKDQARGRRALEDAEDKGREEGRRRT